MGAVQVGHLSLRVMTGLKDKKKLVCLSQLWKKQLGKFDYEERTQKTQEIVEQVSGMLAFPVLEEMKDAVAE